MAKRRVAYRKRNQNKLSMFLVALVVLMVMVVVAVRSMDLQRKLDGFIARETELESLIREEQERTEEIREYEIYTQTKKYAEEVARDKHGLGYPDEIRYKEE